MCNYFYCITEGRDYVLLTREEGRLALGILFIKLCCRRMLKARKEKDNDSVKMFLLNNGWVIIATFLLCS